MKRKRKGEGEGKGEVEPPGRVVPGGFRRAMTIVTSGGEVLPARLVRVVESESETLIDGTVAALRTVTHDVLDDGTNRVTERDATGGN